MSLIKAFNATYERGFVPYRRTEPSYKTLAEEAVEFEKQKATSVTPQLAYLSQRIEELSETCNRLQQQIAATRIEAELSISTRGARIIPPEEQIKAYYHTITTPEDRKLLLSKTRDAQTVAYRISVINKLKEFGATISTIARMMHRDHGTIIHLERSFKRKQLKKNSDQKVIIKRVERLIK